MPEPRVVWIDFPMELRGVVEPYLMREVYLLPRSFVEIRVIHDTTGEGPVAWTAISPEYRNGSIGFSPGWYAGSEFHRGAWIRHELSHFPIERLREFCFDLIKQVQGEPFKEHLREQLRRLVETAVVDVEEMVAIALAVDPCDNKSALAAEAWSPGARP